MNDIGAFRLLVYYNQAKLDFFQQKQSFET